MACVYLSLSSGHRIKAESLVHQGQPAVGQKPTHANMKRFVMGRIQPCIAGNSRQSDGVFCQAGVATVTAHQPQNKNNGHNIAEK